MTKTEDKTIKNNKVASFEEVEKKIEKMLKEAEEKARRIAEGTAENQKGLTETELAEIARNEEYVELKLFRDNDKYKDDVYVAVGDQNCVIKRGVPVRIKRKFYLALEETDEQDFKTAKLIERESGKYKEI